MLLISIIISFSTKRSALYPHSNLMTSYVKGIGNSLKHVYPICWFKFKGCNNTQYVCDFYLRIINFPTNIHKI